MTREKGYWCLDAFVVGVNTNNGGELMKYHWLIDLLTYWLIHHWRFTI